jgi:hypothetical protein
MNKDKFGFSFQDDRQKSNAVLPIAMVVIGASVVLMAVMLLVNEKKNSKENGSYEVENYDVVGNMPYIFGAGE